MALPRRVRPRILDSSHSGLQKLGHFRADTPDAGFHGLCKVEIMPRQHVIEDRKMPFDMNVLQKILVWQERQGEKPAISVKSWRNQQGLTSSRFDFDVLRLQEVGKFLPSRCSEFEIHLAFVQETEPAVPDNWLIPLKTELRQITFFTKKPMRCTVVAALDQGAEYGQAMIVIISRQNPLNA